jgi:hypothetical protein
MKTLLAGLLAALGILAQERMDSRISLEDIGGTQQQPFAPSTGQLSALFFVNTDCPVSNSYAREIRRICTSSGGRVHCYLVYTDPTVDTAAIAKHKADHGHGDYPAIVDANHALVKAAGATVTPEVALVDAAGTLVYRGRIDDSYVMAGRRRAAVTDHNLTDAIESSLAGQPVAQARTKASGCFITPIELLKSLLAKPGLR